MKKIAYLFYIGDTYYIFVCPNFNDEYSCHTELAEFCPHGYIDERLIYNEKN